MRTAVNSFNSLVSLATFRVRALILLMVLAVSFGGAQMLAEQAPTTATSSAPARKSAHPHKRHGVAKAKAQAPAAQATPAPVTPPAPVLPHWPVNDKPVPATVTWDSRGLRIVAANSSLQQILSDVATVIGAKVQGLGADERIYGSYGPGRARDVLSQLLHGSGYNVVLAGDQGEGTPRQIVLSARRAGIASSTANNSSQARDDDDDDDTDEKPIAPARPIPDSERRLPRSPQQMMQHRQPPNNQ
jgi:hypothetical protein